MMKLHSHSYPGTPFSIEAESVENAPGTWASTKISIFRNDVLIGEYLRNYSSHGVLTFHPFVIDNQWYALYSANYTTTRVMKLHDDCIEDWCGQDALPNGFCPIELYVPRYKRIHDSISRDDGTTYEYNYSYVDCDFKTEAEFEQSVKDDGEAAETQYCNFGFMCGCIWGDDSSWKIRYIDLSRIPNKELIITEKFGHWEMPNNLTLKECIDMSNWDLDEPIIRLAKAEYFDLSR